MTSTATPIPAHLTVVAWPDPIVEALGFPPDQAYSEPPAVARPSGGQPLRGVLN